MKTNNRIAKRKNKNSEMGYLRTDFDRSVFQKRLDLIYALPLWARYIVVEFEKNFISTNESGPSYGALLESLINAFEGQFKNTSLPIASRTGINFSILKQIGSNINYAYDLFSSISKFTYIPNNYNYKFLYDLSSQQGYPNLLTANAVSTMNWTGQSSLSWGIPKTTYVLGDNPLTLDMFSLLDLSYFGSTTNPPLLEALNINPTIPAYASLSAIRYKLFSIRPLDFFQGMKDVITAIKWLESENNAIEIRGNVDGVKVDGYETVLNTQLATINQLSDIVENANIATMLDGQKKKDALNALILAKQKDIEAQKIQKRKDIGSMNDLSTNYTAILESKKSTLSSLLVSRIII